jgi:hypothetical protein
MNAYYFSCGEKSNANFRVNGQAITARWAADCGLDFWRLELPRILVFEI